ncbi:MAG: HAMP domain-containing histidine kinase [Myxococcales bacterium]|nr:HAMP domain-containing histidine kinase [Myxococcales bacterium]
MALSVVVHRLTGQTNREPKAWLLVSNVAFDIIAIAAVLAASGGAANPFSAILLVYVALAASMLPALPTFFLTALAACTFGALFLVPSKPSCHVDTSPAAFDNHLYGMWGAFAVGAALVAFFLTRVRRALKERDEALEALRLRAEQSAKLTALGTLAAGTAHELGTPLGTMCVLAREIEGDTLSTDEAKARARTIIEQVDRCREVISRMRAGGSKLGVETDADLEVTVPAAVATWRAAHPDASVEIRRLEAASVMLSRSDVEAALAVLLDNAYAATVAGAARPSDASAKTIVVEAGSERGCSFVSVEDSGAGISPEAEGRVGEPFFTTKPHGEGMGLGLYVVRTLLEPIGGKLEIVRREPHGTRVSIHFAPLASEDGSGALA